MDLVMVIIRTVFFYVFVLIIFRLMGKREIGELSIQDLVVSLLIAELVAISIENYKASILYSLIPIVILVLMQCILAYISLKKPKFRIFLDGNPSLIIKNGKIIYKENSVERAIATVGKIRKTPCIPRGNVLSYQGLCGEAQAV